MRVSLRANELLVFDRGQVVARHIRLTRKGDYHDDLDHYLEILLGKPGALAGSTALASARLEGGFTCAHEAFWAAARDAHGDAAGTRALIEVLLLHRHRRAEFVTAGITAALQAGSVSPELVAIEARKADNAHREATPLLDEQDLTELGVDLADTTVLPAITDDTTPPESQQPAPPAVGPAAPRAASVICLHSRRELLADQRPPPSVDIYDQLLSHRRKGSSA